MIDSYPSLVVIFFLEKPIIPTQVDREGSGFLGPVKQPGNLEETQFKSLSFTVAHVRHGGSYKFDLLIIRRHPITLSEDVRGVQSPPKNKVFRFHCHSEKVSQDP